MKHVVVTLFIIVTIALGLWSWSFDGYRETRTGLARAQAADDHESFAAVLDAFEQRLPSRLLGQFRRFADRDAYARGVLAQMSGDDTRASTSFTGLSQEDTEPEIAFRSRYNQAGLLISRGQLEAAKEQYIQALALFPEDVQTKINLELLLRKIDEQNKGKGNLKDLLEMRGQLSDVWLREHTDQNSQSTQSKRVWR